MGERRSLIRRISEWPEWISLALGMAASGSLFFTKGIGLEFTKPEKDYGVFLEKTLYSIASLVILALFGSLHGFLCTAKRLKDPILKNYFRYMTETYVDFAKTLEFDRTQNIEGKIGLLEKQKEIFLHNSLIDLKIGGLYFKLGRLEESIERLKSAFSSITDDDFKGFIELEKQIYSLAVKYVNKKRISENPNDLESYFNFMAGALLSGKLDEAINCFEKLSCLGLDYRIELNILFSMFLDSLEKRKFGEKQNVKKSENQWKRTVELILEKNHKFEDIGVESRNEVLEIGPSKFLKNTFVFKRGEDKSGLRRGFGVNSGLYRLGEKVLGKEGLQLVRSLYFADNIAGLAYDVSQRKPLRNLDDAFDEIDSDLGKARLLVKALKNERRIHEISREALRDGCFEVDDIKIELKPYDYTETIDRRLLGRFGSSQRGTDLTETIVDEVSPYSGRFECILNGDLAISNLLEDGSVIDYEKACIGNPVIDAVTTLEDPKNGRTGKNWLFKHYYLDQVDGREREFLEESYKPHAVFISMCQTGSKFEQAQRKRDQAGKAKNEFDKAKSLEKAEKDIERSRGFARQVIEKASPKTKDRFVNYLRSSENATEIICAL